MTLFYFFRRHVYRVLLLTAVELARVGGAFQQRPQLAGQAVDLQAVQQPALCLVRLPHGQGPPAGQHRLQLAELRGRHRYKRSGGRPEQSDGAPVSDKGLE